MKKAPTLAMLPFFPRDYLAATRAMTLAERGAYTDLLFYSWDMGPLPQDPTRLARMLGVDSAEFTKTIWPAIAAKFVAIDDTSMVNERLEKERRNSLELRTKASEKAAAAAKARWDSNASRNAPSINDGETFPNQINGNEKTSSANKELQNRKSDSTALANEINGRPMLGAMLEQCPPSPSPSPSSSASSAPEPQEGERGNQSVTCDTQARDTTNASAGHQKASKGETEADRAERIGRFIEKFPTYKNGDLAKMSHTTVQEVEAVKAGARHDDVPG